ncbi:MAG: TetR/AcrR family transcriptional regulator [Burkholderiales bacterium]
MQRNRPSTKKALQVSVQHAARNSGGSSQSQLGKQPAVPGSFENAIRAVRVPTNTRERILHAALLILSDDGFAALTQQHVCERAGIRQSHLTYYFPTRNDLLRETAVFGCETMLSAMTEVTEAHQLTLAEVRQYLFSVDETDRGIGRLWAALVAASDEDPQIKPWFGAFQDENRVKLAALLRGIGIDVEDADIELLHAAYVGATLLDVGESSKKSLACARNIVHYAFDIVTKGLARSRPKPVITSKSRRKQK